MTALARGLLPRALFARTLRPASEPFVLLTFDDGPTPDVTPAVLDLLAAHGARAVFFVVGRLISRAPHVLPMILEAGHAIGNHSYEHPREPVRSYRSYVQDLQRCQAAVEEVTGERPRFHRPPLGTVSFATAFAPRRLGLRSLLWSQSAEDWRFRADEEARRAAATLETAVRPRDILLFHDEKPTTVTLLAELLPALKERGLRLDPDLDEVV